MKGEKNEVSLIPPGCALVYECSMTNTLPGHNKFWKAALHVHHQTVGYYALFAWGRIGYGGQQQILSYGTRYDAQAEIDRRRVDKVGKGYVDDFAPISDTMPKAKATGSLKPSQAGPKPMLFGKMVTLTVNPLKHPAFAAAKAAIEAGAIAVPDALGLGVSEAWLDEAEHAWDYDPVEIARVVMARAGEFCFHKLTATRLPKRAYIGLRWRLEYARDGLTGTSEPPAWQRSMASQELCLKALEREMAVLKESGCVVVMKSGALGEQALTLNGSEPQPVKDAPVEVQRKRRIKLDE